MSNSDNQIIILSPDDIVTDHIDPIPGDRQPILELGQWYWVVNRKKSVNSDGTDSFIESRWFGCVMKIGSNFVELEHPYCSKLGGHVARVHFNNFQNRLIREVNPQQVIDQNIAHFHAQANDQMNQIKAITARLGVTTQTTIEHQQNGLAEANSALMVVSSQNNLKQYEQDLIIAKEKLLPDLFQAVKNSNLELTRWMTASTLPMKALSNSLSGTIGEITDRIFNVGLYAGLTEKIIMCSDGEPGAYHEKLHVLQRMHYMDEECLLNYRHGGMDFDNLSQFDEWISEPANRDRILPFSKCLIAMRIRRKEKERSWDGTLQSIFINFNMSISDKFTYLYIRNGEQVSRLVSDLDFGEKIFPDRSVFDPSRPLMIKMFCSRVERVMTVDEYEVKVAEYHVNKTNYDQWVKENPQEEWEMANPKKIWHWANPFHNSNPSQFQPDSWEPFDQNHLYFDEITEYFATKIKEYNRVALIIQGLFDRSPVLHPHPPVSIWSPNGFATAIELIFDASSVLHHGEAPDIEAYIARCNESLDVGSNTIGQDLFWTEKEAEKLCRRLDNSWTSSRSDYRPTHHRPYGNPGPGYIAQIDVWKPRSRVATFAWDRERQTNDTWTGKQHGDPIRTTIAVPSNRLFNVDAYKLGDYLQFFRDSRTRQQYLKWAPLLLAAEEFHAGNISKFNSRFEN